MSSNQEFIYPLLRIFKIENKTDPIINERGIAIPRLLCKSPLCGYTLKKIIGEREGCGTGLTQGSLYLLRACTC